jgi:hypothetical protein
MDEIVLRPKPLVRLTFDCLGVVFVVSAVATSAWLGALPVLALVATGVVGVNRIRLVAADGRLTSCGGLRTRQWDRAQIERFVLSRQPLGSGWVEVVLRDGTAWSLSATKVTLGRRQAEDMLRRLNSWMSTAG